MADAAMPHENNPEKPVDGLIEETLAPALDWFFARQQKDGYWVARLESNATMEAEWILALHILGLDDHPLRQRLANAVLREQRPDGAWGVYHDAPAGDVSATVECYAALRSAGYPASDPRLERARDWIRQRDGLRNVRVFTRYWLALIGEWPWDRTPNIPPEVVFFPNWFPFSIYNFAQWARATLMPIAVLSARRPVAPLPPEARLDELFPSGRAAFDYELPTKPNADIWDKFFRGADRVLHALQNAGPMFRWSPTPDWRDAAVKHVLEWIIKHQDADGVWGGIQPPWIYSLMAIHSEGYDLRHPVMAKGLGALDDPRWRVDVEEASYVQACTSPIWDTVLGVMAVQDAEADEENMAAVEKALDWVLARQVLSWGDWQVKVPNVAPGGWSFEYENLRYPDTDDTAVALIALAPYRDDPKWRAKGIREAIDRGVDWLFGMQCKGGGWGAFDKDNDKKYLTKIPFCDFGEALDPPSVDVTAHILEALGKLGYTRAHPAVARAIDWLKAEQEADGAWFGRWGVNYVYGTGAVLPALEAVGEDMSQPYIQRAADWLKSTQQESGGWGESCASYMRVDMRGKGAETPSQTAWGLMGLAAAGRAQDRDAVTKGVRFLHASQKDGTWDEPHYTGTGFPGYGVGATIKLGDPKLDAQLSQGAELSRAFMIRYNMYRHYFPISALGRARGYLARKPNRSGEDVAPPPGTGEGGDGRATGQAGAAVEPAAVAQTSSQAFAPSEERSRAFMLNFNLYRNYFPILALSRARTFLSAAGAESSAR